MALEPIHKPVLLKESIDFLSVQEGVWYVDATLGQAGHALEIIRRGGRVLGIETNPETLSWLSKNIKEPSLRVIEGNFRDVKDLVYKNDVRGVGGVLFDLGLSTFELTKSGKGLSYLRDEPLDMRLGPTNFGVTAADLLNDLNEQEIYEIFIKFGEIRDALSLSESLVRRRSIRKIKTTQDLVSLVESALLPKDRYKVLSQVFQALRMAVNDDLGNLEKGLDGAETLLEKGGRLAVISFHSLEDRIIKQQFLKDQGLGVGRILTGSPIRPERGEVDQNSAARSAKLRVLEKL